MLLNCTSQSLLNICFPFLSQNCKTASSISTGNVDPGIEPSTGVWAMDYSSHH